MSNMNSTSQEKRTWAEIDLDALSHNYHRIRDLTGPGVKCLGIVKADAYGHGAVQISKKLEDLGVDYLAVATFDEACELRRNGIHVPILVLGYTPVELTSELVGNDITQSVSNYVDARAYSDAAMSCGKPLTVHIKTDTGMSRIGFSMRANFDAEVQAILDSCALPGLSTEGIFTHFSVADQNDPDSRDYTLKQLDLFNQTINAVEAGGHSFSIRHCANSGGIANYPEAYLDMVRPGIILYGAGEDAIRLGLRPVMTVKSKVYAIKQQPANTDIGYGRSYRTEDDTRIGVLAIGYADGLRRDLSNKGVALRTAAGFAPIRGRICMDMTMVDVSALPEVRVGDVVEVFGPQQRIDEFAAILKTVPNELLCAVSKRVPRVYIG